MQKIFKLLGLSLGLLLVFGVDSHAQEMTKEDIKQNKDLMGVWEVENIIKGTRVIDLPSIAGETFMYFYEYKKKDNDGNVKVTYKFKMNFGGTSRIFDYIVAQDSVKYVNVTGWNDLQIIELEKKKTLVVDQLSEGEIVRWNLKARKDMDVPKPQKKKKKKKKEDKNTGRRW